jgi:microcystin-dependent protein
MAINLSLSNIGSGYNRTVINNNFEAIVSALQDALSKSGVSPNQMTADIDLNTNDLLNVGHLHVNQLFLDGTEVVTDLLSKGDKGWSPSFGVVSDGTRRVLQLVAWVGGDGDTPTSYLNQYVGATGFTSVLANGVDIRGPQGASGAGTGDMLSTQNLNDVASKPTAFDNIKQTATTTSSGVAEVATVAEAVAVTDNDKMITPLLMASFVPIGTVFDYLGTTAPTGWLFPYGQLLSRTTYSALFALIGTTFGVGDNSTTFNAPDLRGRVVVGKDNMGATSADRLTGLSGGVDGDVLGATGGSETHVLDTTQIPAHTHTIGPKTARYGANGQSYADWQPSAGDSDRNTVSVTSNATGGGLAHNNVQPSMVLNKIMFVGV